MRETQKEGSNSLAIMFFSSLYKTLNRYSKKDKIVNVDVVDVLKNEQDGIDIVQLRKMQSYNGFNPEQSLSCDTEKLLLSPLSVLFSSQL